jgi:hypothetical protein
LPAHKLAGAGTALQKFHEFGKRKTALFEDIRESSLRKLGVHGNDRPPSFVADSSFK